MRKLSFFVLLGLILSFNLSTLHAAIIDVNTTDDDFGTNLSDCSLREAIESVNNQADFGGCDQTRTGTYGDNDTIRLEAATYTLTRSGSCEDSNEIGDLDIEVPVTINGARQSQTVVTALGLIDSGSAEDRVFDLGPGFFDEGIAAGGFNSLGITVNFNGFTVTEGNTREPDNYCKRIGGGILVGYFSTLNMTGVRVTNNESGYHGGGIGNFGVLNATDSRVDTNRAYMDGGGIASSF